MAELSPHMHPDAVRDLFEGWDETNNGTLDQAKLRRLLKRLLEEEALMDDHERQLRDRVIRVEKEQQRLVEAATRIEKTVAAAPFASHSPRPTPRLAPPGPPPLLRTSSC